MLAAGFMLPVLLFHMLAATTYTAQTAKIIGVLFLNLSLAFVLGMIMKKKFPALGTFSLYCIIYNTCVYRIGCCLLSKERENDGSIGYYRKNWYCTGSSA